MLVEGLSGEDLEGKKGELVWWAVFVVLTVDRQRQDGAWGSLD